jgi:hypothetical protein
MFRSSELVGIRWEDVREHRRGLLLYAPRSKTDQAGEGAWVFIASCAQCAGQCALYRRCSGCGGSQGRIAGVR